MVLVIKTRPVQLTARWGIMRRKRGEEAQKEKGGKGERDEGGQRNQSRDTRARAC